MTTTRRRPLTWRNLARLAVALLMFWLLIAFTTSAVIVGYRAAMIAGTAAADLILAHE